jgi:predicted adenine nucleotide alpha hydrolase (AANH) superfamily ATPase
MVIYSGRYSKMYEIYKGRKYTGCGYSKMWVDEQQDTQQETQQDTIASEMNI